MHALLEMLLVILLGAISWLVYSFWHWTGFNFFLTWRPFPLLTPEASEIIPILHEHHIIAKNGKLLPIKIAGAKQEFVQLGICRPSKSCWASPLLMVHKKSNDWRPCDDYSRLYALSIPCRYPIPHMQNFTSNLSSKKLTTTLNPVWAYFQTNTCQEIRLLYISFVSTVRIFTSHLDWEIAA